MFFSILFTFRLTNCLLKNHVWNYVMVFTHYAIERAHTRCVLPRTVRSFVSSHPPSLFTAQLIYLDHCPASNSQKTFFLSNFEIFIFRVLRGVTKVMSDDEELQLAIEISKWVFYETTPDVSVMLLLPDLDSFQWVPRLPDKLSNKNKTWEQRKMIWSVLNPPMNLHVRRKSIRSSNFLRLASLDRPVILC